MPVWFWLCISLQCFPEGTDMTSVLDLYFQVSLAMILFPSVLVSNSNSFLMTRYTIDSLRASRPDPVSASLEKASRGFLSTKHFLFSRCFSPWATGSLCVKYRCTYSIVYLIRWKVHSLHVQMWVSPVSIKCIICTYLRVQIRTRKSPWGRLSPCLHTGQSALTSYWSTPQNTSLAMSH